MAAEVQGSRTQSTSTVPFWRDERIRGLIAQFVVGLLLVGLIWYLGYNMVLNQQRLGVPMSLSFLDAPAGFQLSFAAISVTLDSPISRILLVGALNTLFAAAICAVLATVVGVLIGILRLSNNWLIAKLAAAYIEALRNTPLLLQLVFWYSAVIAFLPAVRESLSLFDVVFLNKKGLFTPQPIFEPGAIWVGLIFVAAVAGSVTLRRWAHQRQEATGQRFPVFTVSIAAIILLPVLASLVLGNPVTWEVPVKGGFNFQGGLTFQPEIVALILGLSLNTSAFIAEIVRSGIQSVPRGQWDAANALGLRRSFMLRQIILPQALRVIVPPMTSQYLNLTKNSSLAVAIGYQDVVSIANTTLNQTGQAIEAIALIMAVFLTISLGISFFMNWYNARIALVER